MSSGLSDEAVIEGHDLIERAETEEREVSTVPIHMTRS